MDLECTRSPFAVLGQPHASFLQVAEERVLLGVAALSHCLEGGTRAFSRLLSQLLSDYSITRLSEHSSPGPSPVHISTPDLSPPRALRKHWASSRDRKTNSPESQIPTGHGWWQI